jgi:pilus assembly protein CpaC
MFRTLLLAAAAALPAAMVPMAHIAAAETDARGVMTLQAGTGKVVHLKAPASNIFVADPKIAEVKPASSDSLFIWGIAGGSTTVAVLNGNGETVAQFQVTVTPSTYDAKQADFSGVSSRALRARETPGGISLSGTVPTPLDAFRAVNAAKGQLPADGKVDNRLTVADPVQVSLHVRIAEMNRTITRELGVNWATGANGDSPARLGQHVQFGVATNTQTVDNSLTPASAMLQLVHGWNLDTVVQALADDQLIHLLAEPNLTTLSGQPANFLVGGEFPVPVASNANTISVEFKQYGISLSFLPTVLSNGQISLHVRPEVSQLDKANGVTFFFGTANESSGIAIPGLDVRRADTTVMLGTGQSFAIAGLLQDQTTLTGNAVPGLGEVPILGALFRSDSFQRNQSELVIIVTPYIVKPVNDPNALHLPTDGWRPPTDIERILYLRQSAPGYAGTTAPVRHIPADAGFMVE